MFNMIFLCSYYNFGPVHHSFIAVVCKQMDPCVLGSCHYICIQYRDLHQARCVSHRLRKTLHTLKLEITTYLMWCLCRYFLFLAVGSIQSHASVLIWNSGRISFHVQFSYGKMSLLEEWQVKCEENAISQNEQYIFLVFRHMIAPDRSHNCLRLAVYYLYHLRKKLLCHVEKKDLLCHRFKHNSYIRSQFCVLRAGFEERLCFVVENSNIW